MTRHRLITIDAEGRSLTATFVDGVQSDVVHDLRPLASSGQADPSFDIPTWVIVPGQDVLLRLIDLPPGAEVKAASTLPFLLEDDVASGVEGLHFALGTAVSSGQRSVGVVGRDKMKSWLTQLDVAGLSTDVIVPDYFAIPKSDKNAVIVFRSDVAIISLPNGTGFSAEVSLADNILPAIVASFPAREIEVYGKASDIARIQKCLPEFVVIKQAPFSENDFLQAAYRRLEGRIDLNLRQGAFARGRQWKLNLQPWRRAAALFLAFAGLAAVYQFAAGVRYNIEAEKAMTEADRIARAVLPASTRLVNPRAQVKAHLESMRSGSSDNFIQLSELLAESLKASGDGALEAIQFDHARGTVAASVTVPTYDAIEKLKTEIKGRGAIVEDGEARQSGPFIVSEISVSLP